MQLPPAAYGGPVRRLNPAVRVRVWVPRSREGWTQLDGEADAWTDVAAHVSYSDEHGRGGTVWVWAGAVTRAAAGPGVAARSAHVVRARGIQTGPAEQEPERKNQEPAERERE